MNWKDIREATKKEDRYYKVYDDPEGFWVTLDSKIVAWTYNIPLGIIPRVIYSIIGLSNRHEPMPIGNRKYINNLWKDKPSWIRYILWKIRNPWEDLKKFYLGFATAEDVTYTQITDHFKIWWAKFSWCSFRVPFPYFTWEGNYVELKIGWKSRGILSFTVRRK